MAPHDPKMVAALRVERAGYARRGLDDRVAEVDEQLAYYGASPEDEAPAGRTADPGLQTTDTSTPTGHRVGGRRRRRRLRIARSRHHRRGGRGQRQRGRGRRPGHLDGQQHPGQGAPRPRQQAAIPDASKG
jgi:hypothetical protein